MSITDQRSMNMHNPSALGIRLRLEVWQLPFTTRDTPENAESYHQIRSTYLPAEKRAMIVRMGAGEESTVTPVRHQAHQGLRIASPMAQSAKRDVIPEGTENDLCRDNHGVYSGIEPQIKITECTPVEFKIAFVKSVSVTLMKGGECGMDGGILYWIPQNYK